MHVNNLYFAVIKQYENVKSQEFIKTFSFKGSWEFPQHYQEMKNE